MDEKKEEENTKKKQTLAKVSQLEKVIYYLKSHLETYLFQMEQIENKGKKDVDNVLDDAEKKLQASMSEIEKIFSNPPEILENEYKERVQLLMDGFNHSKKKGNSGIRRITHRVHDLKKDVEEYSSTKLHQLAVQMKVLDQSLDIDPDNVMSKIQEMKEKQQDMIDIHDAESQRKLDNFYKQAKINRERLILEYKRKIGNVSVFNKIPPKQKDQAYNLLKTQKEKLNDAKTKVDQDKQKIEAIMKQYNQTFKISKSEYSRIMRQISIEHKKRTEKEVELQNELSQIKSSDEYNRLNDIRKEKQRTYTQSEQDKEEELRKLKQKNEKELQELLNIKNGKYDEIVKEIENEQQERYDKFEKGLREKEKQSLNRLKQLQNEIEEEKAKNVSREDLNKLKQENEEKLNKMKQKMQDEIDDENRIFKNTVEDMEKQISVSRTIHKQIQSTQETKQHLEKELQYIKELGKKEKEKEEEFYKQKMKDPAFIEKYEALDDQLNSSFDTMQDDMDDQLQEIKDEIKKEKNKIERKIADEIENYKKELSAKNEESKNEFDKVKQEYDTVLGEYNNIKGDENEEEEEDLETLERELTKMKQNAENEKNNLISKYENEYSELTKKINSTNDSQPQNQQENTILNKINNELLDSISQLIKISYELEIAQINADFAHKEYELNIEMDKEKNKLSLSKDNQLNNESNDDNMKIIHLEQLQTEIKYLKQELEIRQNNGQSLETISNCLEKISELKESELNETQNKLNEIMKSIEEITKNNKEMPKDQVLSIPKSSEVRSNSVLGHAKRGITSDGKPKVITPKH